MSGHIRRATAVDEDAWLMLRRLMFAEMGLAAAVLDDPAWQQAARAWFRAHVDDPDAFMALADVEGQVVASACGEVTALIPSPTTPTGSVGLVTNVATLPTHREQGWASDCTDAVLLWFEQETDVDRLDLFATDGGAVIYRRRGFVTAPNPAMRRRLRRPGTGSSPAP